MRTKKRAFFTSYNPLAASSITRREQISEELGKRLPFDNLNQLRTLLTELHPGLQQVDEVPINEWKPLKIGKLIEKDFMNYVDDFYLTNPIARASTVMAELSASAKARNNPKVAAE